MDWERAHVDPAPETVVQLVEGRKNSDVTEYLAAFTTCLCEEVVVVVTVEACDEERKYVGTAVAEELSQFLSPRLPQTQTSVVSL